MSTKFLLLPFFGFFIPLLLYIFITDIQTRARVRIDPVGDVETKFAEALGEVIPIKQSESIFFAGDILMARHVEFLMEKKGGDYPFKNVHDIFSNAHFIVGNFESAILTNHKKTPSFVTTFSVDAKYLPLLSKASFTHLSLANNHSLDYGAETFSNTIKSLEAVGIETFGQPQEVSTSSTKVIITGDYKVGLIAINLINSDVSYADILKQIETLSTQSDYQVAYIHWGDEYILKHNSTQENFARKIIDSGIDAVVGHHPHVVQDIEIYNNAPIFYSLGNFLFDQYFSVDVQQGLVLELKIQNESIEYNLVPVSSEGSLSQPYLMPDKEKSIFLKNLARRSDPKYTENIALGKLIFTTSLASSSQNGIIGQ